MKSNVREWDVTVYLDSEEAIAAYLNAAREEGDAVLLQAAMEDIAKIQKMHEVDQKVNIDRISL